MKTLSTCLIIFITMLCANAQSIQLFDHNGVIRNNDTLVFYHVIDSTLGPTLFENVDIIKAYNNSIDTLDIDLTRIKLQGINGATDYVLWGTNYYVAPTGGAAIWNLNDPLKTNPFDTVGYLPFTVSMYANNLPGNAFFKYEFKDINNSVNTASVTVHFVLSYLTGLSQEEISSFGFNVYPNPVSNRINIQFKSKLNFRKQYIDILDITGKLVSTHIVPSRSDNYNFNIENINSGIYFVRLIAEGVLIETKKIIVK